MLNKFSISERLKSVIIVVLFLITVLLSYLYWHGENFTGLKETVNNRLSNQAFTTAAGPETASLVCPETVSVNFGDGTYCQITENAGPLWEEFLPIYIDFTKMSNLMIEEITRDQWNESLEYSSITYNFGYDISNSYFESLGAANYGETDYFDSIYSISCTEAGETAVLIKNETSDKYFRVIADSEYFNLEELLNKIRKSEDSGTASLSVDEASFSYYPANLLAGTDNRTYLPYDAAVLLRPLRISTQGVSTYERNLAETFFGKGLDFVRKVTDDSGIIIYMYGYNRTTLSIYPDGYFEYTDTPTSPDTALSFNQALSIASDFISGHGTWSSYDETKTGYILKDFSSDTKGKSSFYRFCFETVYDNLPLIGAEGYDIVIELEGDQVTFYSRNALAFTSTSLTAEEVPASRNASVTDILASSYAQITDAIYEMGGSVTLDGGTYGENMERVLSQLTSAAPGYLQTSKESSILTPVWILSFKEGKVFFDLYSGAYLGYKKEGER